eukprot:2230713-Pyramimonas_sp.AAC.1
MLVGEVPGRAAIFCHVLAIIPSSASRRRSSSASAAHPLRPAPETNAWNNFLFILSVVSEDQRHPRCL